MTPFSGPENAAILKTQKRCNFSAPPTKNIVLRVFSAGLKCGSLNVGTSNPKESGTKVPRSCNAAFSMLHCSFSLAAAQLLVKMTSALQKNNCRSATSAVQLSENCSATSAFACGMLQKESGKRSSGKRSVAKKWQKRQKMWPETYRKWKSDRTLFAAPWKTCDFVLCDLKMQRFFCDCDLVGTLSS